MVAPVHTMNLPPLNGAAFSPDSTINDGPVGPLPRGVVPRITRFPRWSSDGTLVMDVATLEQDGHLVVASGLHSELTEPEARQLLDDLTGSIRYDGARFVVLDMTGVCMVSSVCLESLLLLFQELEHIRGRVAVANCLPAVKGIFTVTRLDALFEIYDDVEEAVANLHPG